MPEETKKCKYCGEEILAVARKCKHCGEMLDDEAQAGNESSANSNLTWWQIVLGLGFGMLVLWAMIEKDIEDNKSPKPAKTVINSPVIGSANGYLTYNSENISLLQNKDLKFKLYDAYDDDFKGGLEISNHFLIETSNQYTTRSVYPIGGYALPYANCIGEKKESVEYGSMQIVQNFLCVAVKDFTKENATSYNGTRYTFHGKKNDLFFAYLTNGGISTFYKLKK